MSARALSECVVFEVADIALATGLAERLARRWEVAVNAEAADTVVIVAEIRPERGDVALLLRDVQAFIAQESLCALRFELDGRPYVLEAGEADWSIDLASDDEALRGGRRARLLKALGSVDRALLASRTPTSPTTQIRGLEALRQDISFALRLNEDSA